MKTSNYLKLPAVFLIVFSFLSLLSLLSFFSSNTYASGKLTLKESYSFDTKKFHPTIGLSIYQKIKLGLAYNGWTGMGEPTRGLDVGTQWYLTKHAVEFSLWRVTVGIGGQVEYYSKSKEWGKGCFGSISLKLWN